MAAPTITKEQFEHLIQANIVMVDFTAAWCGPCQAMSPILDELADEYPDIQVVKVDVDAESELATRYGVMTIPNIQWIENGVVKDTRIGRGLKHELVEFINKNLAAG